MYLNYVLHEGLNQSYKFSLCRSSRSEVFLRKRFLKICSKFTGEHPCRSVSQLYWKHTLAWAFSYKFVACFHNIKNTSEGPHLRILIALLALMTFFKELRKKKKKTDVKKNIREFDATDLFLFSLESLGNLVALVARNGLITNKK